MLSSSLSLGPLAAAAAAPAGAAAVANGAPAVALEAASEAVAENPGMLCTPACAGADAARRSLNSPGPFGRAAAGTCMRIKTASESDPSKCLQPEACGAEVAPAAAPLLQPASPTASTGMHNGVTTLRQKVSRWWTVASPRMHPTLAETCLDSDTLCVVPPCGDSAFSRAQGSRPGWQRACSRLGCTPAAVEPGVC